MKKTWSHIILACLLLAGCSRKEPVLPDSPDDLETLRPATVIDLSSTIPEPSGIVYCQKNNSLLIVSDSRFDIYETDLNGRVLRTIPTTSTDMEGITLSAGGDSIFVVEERNQLVSCYAWNGARLFSFPVKVATLDNNALEGVALGPQRHLFVINEKNPRLLLEFAGTAELWRKEITAVNDLSDICYDATEDVLWLVSDESRKVVKLSTAGEVLAEWLVPFDKGEGITFVGNTMYIVNDADAHMYLFAKPAK